MKLTILILSMLLVVLGCRESAESVTFPYTLGAEMPVSIEIDMVDFDGTPAVRTAFACNEPVMYESTWDEFIWEGEQKVGGDSLFTDGRVYECEVTGEPITIIDRSLSELPLNEPMTMRVGVRYDDTGYVVEQTLTRTADGWRATEATMHEDTVNPPFILAGGKEVYMRIRGSVDSWQIELVCGYALDARPLVEIDVAHDNNTLSGVIDNAFDEPLSCDEGEVIYSSPLAIDTVEVGETVRANIVVRFEEGGYDAGQAYTRTKNGWELGASSRADG